jgi:hypothetical protein
MTDEAKNQADEIAELRKEVEALKAATAPAPAVDWERRVAEHRDQMHALSERRMNFAHPPEVVRYFADGVTPADCADLRHQAHRPTGRPGMIPEQPSNVRAPQPSSTPGWVAPTPLSNPPGVAQTDKLMDEQDRRDRAELAQRLGALKR